VLALRRRGDPPDATRPQVARSGNVSAGLDADLGDQSPLAFEVVSKAVAGNRIYLEALVEHADGTMIPNMNILEVENGKIRRGRVYTDRPTRDGVSINAFVRDLKPARATQEDTTVYRDVTRRSKALIGSDTPRDERPS